MILKSRIVIYHNLTSEKDAVRKQVVGSVRKCQQVTLAVPTVYLPEDIETRSNSSSSNLVRVLIL